MIATKELDHPHRQYITYPPSILIVGDSSSQALKLKQKLEKKGCQVCWADISSASLAAACQKYFELIVLNLERPDVDGFAARKKLKANPELANIPVVMLTTHQPAQDIINRLNLGPVYCPSNDISDEAKLSQIIEQIHYMTYRYI